MFVYFDLRYFWFSEKCLYSICMYKMLFLCRFDLLVIDITGTYCVVLCCGKQFIIFDVYLKCMFVFVKWPQPGNVAIDLRHNMALFNDINYNKIVLFLIMKHIFI